MQQTLPANCSNGNEISSIINCGYLTTIVQASLKLSYTFILHGHSREQLLIVVVVVVVAGSVTLCLPLATRPMSTSTPWDVWWTRSCMQWEQLVSTKEERGTTMPSTLIPITRQIMGQAHAHTQEAHLWIYLTCIRNSFMWPSMELPVQTH